MDEQTEILREMRDLLRVIAEPALAELDKRRRASLREIVGKSKARAGAVFFMDGSRTQAVLSKESGIDSGNMSRFVKNLKSKDLIKGDERRPALAIQIPTNFFDTTGSEDE